MRGRDGVRAKIVVVFQGRLRLACDNIKIWVENNVETFKMKFDVSFHIYVCTE